MNGPVELLLRVDCVEYARTVLVFCKPSATMETTQSKRL